jgi:hypothetical protein
MAFTVGNYGNRTRPIIPLQYFPSSFAVVEREIHTTNLHQNEDEEQYEFNNG